MGCVSTAASAESVPPAASGVRHDRLGFLDQPHGRVVQVVQLRRAGLVLGELDQVAALEELAQALLLVGSEQVGALQLVQELLGRALGRMEIEPLLQVPADRIGHEDAELAGLADHGQRLPQLLLGSDVGRHSGTIRPARAASSSTAMPARPAPATASTSSIHQSHAQPLGISTGGLMSRRALVSAAAARAEARCRFVAVIGRRVGHVGRPHASSPEPPLLARLEKPAQLRRIRLVGAQADGIYADRTGTAARGRPGRGPAARRRPPACAHRPC